MIGDNCREIREVSGYKLADATGAVVARLPTGGLGRRLALPSKSSGVRPDRTSATICFRNSAAYGGLDFGIANTSSSQQDQLSAKPGKLQIGQRIDDTNRRIDDANREAIEPNGRRIDERFDALQALILEALEARRAQAD